MTPGYRPQHQGRTTPPKPRPGGDLASVPAVAASVTRVPDVEAAAGAALDQVMGPLRTTPITFAHYTGEAAVTLATIGTTQPDDAAEWRPLLDLLLENPEAVLVLAQARGRRPPGV